MAQDHNDIYSIVERLAILEGRITPTNVKHGLNAQQRSVPQMPALFKPKTQKILGGDADAKNPVAGYSFGDDIQDQRQPVEEAEVIEDVLDQVKSSLVDYLKSVEDRYKDSNLKDKVKVDRDLGKKDTRDRDLIAKIKDAVAEEAVAEDHRKLEVGDRICVTGPNHYEGEFGEIAEFSPSGKFVVVKFDNSDEASMHLSDVEYHDDQEDDYEEVDEDSEIAAALSGTIPAAQPAGEPGVSMKESQPVKTVTNECGLWEVHGDEPSGFEIRHGNRAMRSRFKTIEEAEMALEMFAARRAKQDESADYIEEA